MSALRAMRKYALTFSTDGRTTTYITPERVQAALDLGEPPIVVAVDVLGIIAKQGDVGIEDPSLCAFTAWQALNGGRA